MEFNWPLGFSKLFFEKCPCSFYFSSRRLLPPPRHSICLPCSLSIFFFIFLIRSPRSRPTSLVSRSQARSLMELFRRTISRAGSAFFIEHWPFELPWNSPRRIVTRELIQRKSSSGLGLTAGNVSNIRWTITRPLQNRVHCFWPARFHNIFAFRTVTFKCTRKSNAARW